MSPYSSNLLALRRVRGFSLLEVLVAFVVLALALGVIMRIFAQGTGRVSESDFYARAVIVAESKLAQVGAGIPLEVGETSGEGGDALRWRVRLAEYAVDSDKAVDAGSVARAPLAVRLLQVEVEVNGAPAQTAPSSVRLVTLRLAPRTVR